MMEESYVLMPQWVPPDMHKEARNNTLMHKLNLSKVQIDLFQPSPSFMAHIYYADAHEYHVETQGG